MRYWVYVNGEVPGSYDPEGLASLPGFGMTTLVCPAEGEIAEKNWRRAGEFDEIARAVGLIARVRVPEAPASLAAAAATSAAAATEVDSLIDTASTRLFGHVAELMRELEGHREEKALILSLQRQIAAVKEQLVQERERSSLLEMRANRNAELEETVRRDRASLDAATDTLRIKEAALGESRASVEKLTAELEGAVRRAQESQNDLLVRNRLLDKLSKDLSDKELSLAKSLGVIRRLEEDLAHIVPRPAPAPSAQPAEPPAPRKGLPEIPNLLRSAPEPAPQPAPEPRSETTRVLPLENDPLHRGASSAPLGSFTEDNPPQAPPYLEPHPPTLPEKAQAALLSFLRKVFPGQPH